MKRLFLYMACAAIAFSVGAQGIRHQARHYYRFTLGLAECNTLTFPGTSLDVTVKDLPGMALHLGAGYEWDFRNVYFGTDLQVDYNLTALSADLTQEDVRTGYIDRALCVDGLQMPVSYHYIYHSIRERQNQLNGALQLYTGGLIGRSFYAQGGVKVAAMLYGNHRAAIHLATRKVYDDILVPEVEEASALDGNYADHLVQPHPGADYGWQASSANVNPLRLTLSPVLEAGYRTPLHSRRSTSQLRIGFFAEWAIPLCSTIGQESMLFDYSRLEERKHASGLILIPDNTAQLDHLLTVGSLLNSEYIAHSSAMSITRLTLGVRATILLRSPSRKACRCLRY